ncbi:serine--tRNA ligase [Hyphobacterium sp. CCMP332]|nr:serine--tRNA ligase [Hyphobacterium sp. CCMP332]
MLELKNIIQNKASIAKALGKRNIADAGGILEEIIAEDEKRRAIQRENDDLLAEANQIAKSIGTLMKSGNKEEAEKAKKRSSELKQKTKELGNSLKEIENKLVQLLYQIPNAPHESVPAGHSAEDNINVFQSGTTPELQSNAKPHWELIEDLDIIDFKLGVKITGAGFPVYKGKGAKLQRALINFFLFEAGNAGYDEVQPPIVINEESGYGTGQLPDKEGMMYEVEKEKLFLIPTAEVPITNLYRDVILKDSDLPIKNVGYTPCFRREAGSWGSHVRGLNRLHQFDKVEIVQISKPEDSYKTLDEMCEHVASLLEKLELPYRKLKLCGGDMGFTSALTFDFEVFAAAQKKWLEVSSVSNFETYQANRLKLRYKNEEGKTSLLHTLNGSALALPRIVAALLENNQKDGHISIPKALQAYTGFDKI